MAGTPANDPAAALAGMAKVGNPRVPMGNAAYSLGSTPPPLKGALKKRGNTQAGDPTAQGTKVNRQRSPYPLPAGSGDRDGAAFRVQASFPVATAPEAGRTQGNGRIVKAAVNRSLPSFQDGSAASY